MINCDVICDLMEVIHSGEASEESIKFVEAHLDKCHACFEKHQKEQGIKDQLALLAEKEEQTNGGIGFILRFKWVSFSILLVALLLLVGFLNFFSRVIVSDIFILPIEKTPFLFSSEWLVVFPVYLVVYFYSERRVEVIKQKLWLFLRLLLLLIFAFSSLSLEAYYPPYGGVAIGLLLLAWFIFLIKRRMTVTVKDKWRDVLTSIEAVIPLTALGFLFISMELSASSYFVFNGVKYFILIFSILFLLKNIYRLRYQAKAIMYSLMITILILIIQPAYHVFNSFDMLPISVQSLGVPKSREDLINDFHPQKLSGPLDRISPNWLTQDEGIKGFEIPINNGNALSLEYKYYTPDPRTVILRMVEFNDIESAEFYMDQIRSELIIKILPVYRDQNDIFLFKDSDFIRAYSSESRFAYNVWQNENWVMIINAEGPLFEAIPIAHEVRESVAESFALP